MQPVLSPIARIAATSSSLSFCSAGSAASSARLLLDRARLGAGLLDQGRHHALDRGVGEVPLAGELDRRQAGSLGVGQHLLQLLQPGLDPAFGAEGAVVAAGQLHAGPQVAPEEAAVVDDAGDHLDAVALGRVEDRARRARARTG